MWQRDPNVQTMIDYLDRDLPLKLIKGEDALEEWDALPSSEKFKACSPADRAAILEQQRDVCDDFIYAARNYFWITTKQKKDKLFALWEAQHLILQCYYDLKAKGKAQKIIICKARQLGCSTLIEGMIAWRALFFPNTNAIVVSVDQPHSSYLFSLMSHIYDKLPWWLKPMVARREEKFGMWFENPDQEQRLRHPGLNSKVFVQWSNQYSGVGQGIPIDAAHVSEYSDFLEEDLDSIVNEDLGNSMAEDPEVFGFMESTGRGAGTEAHLLWRACERRLDQGKWPKWYPLFLPSFFETTRVLPPPQGWTAARPEEVLRTRVNKEWARCDNDACGRYRKGIVMGESTIGLTCPECLQGKLAPVVLTDAQLYWHQDKREQAEEQGQKAVKKFKQEQATTAEECWQTSGFVLFNDACQEWMQETIDERPVIRGFIDPFTGDIHGANPANGGRCYSDTCKLDHRHSETPLWIWEPPIHGARYVVGVDVSEGIGEDYSVAFVNKIGNRGACDEQVAVWRDNHTKPKPLAVFANIIGRWYNDALMAVEYNTYQTTGDDLVYKHMYPNIFQWKHLDSIHPLASKWHWWTKPNTKAYLHQTAVDWLEQRCWIIRSRNFSEETTTYNKDEFASRSFGAAAGCHDDELMAGMISLYTAHEMDCDEFGRVRIPTKDEAAADEAQARWEMTCTRCGKQWKVVSPEDAFRCPDEDCGSIYLTAEPLQVLEQKLKLNEGDPRSVMDQARDMLDPSRRQNRELGGDWAKVPGMTKPDIPLDHY